MAYSYKKLWKLLIDKDMKKIELRDSIAITPSTLAKLSKNEPVNMEILARICKRLECNIGDIVDYIPDTEDKND